MAEKNLKITAIADTSRYNSSMKAAKAATQDFANTADGALSGLSDSLGVNTELVNKLNRSLKAVAANPIIALGSAALAGLAAGFKALNSESEAWAKTVAGVRDNLQDTAYINTYKQAMHDANAEIAEQWDNMWDGFKQKGQTAIANLKTGFAQLVANLKDGQGLGEAFRNAKDTVSEASAEAEEKAQQAAENAGKVFDIQRKQKTNLVEIARIDARIAELREKAADATLSARDRLDANAEAMELIRQKYAMQIPLANQLAGLLKQTTDLTASTPEELDKMIDAQVTAIGLRREEADAIRALLRLQNTLNKAVREEFLSKVNTNLGVSGSLEGAGLGKGQEGIILPVRAEFDFESWQEAQARMQEQMAVMRDIAREAFETIGDILGELVGNLITGGDAWGDFKSAALSAFAGMAQMVGKIAIATGTASLAIKGSLESLDPTKSVGAIMAGTALVALGAAVKAGLSNVANGGSVSAVSVASSAGSTSSSMAGGYSSREVTVKVTGTLKASGSQLVAVLNNEQQRQTYTR